MGKTSNRSKWSDPDMIRIVLDVKQELAKKLTEISKAEGRSRKVMLERAIADYAEKHQVEVT